MCMVTKVQVQGQTSTCSSMIQLCFACHFINFITVKVYLSNVRIGTIHITVYIINTPVTKRQLTRQGTTNATEINKQS